MRAHLLAPLLVLGLAACELLGPGTARSGRSVDGAVTLREGESARIDSLDAALRFDRLLSESRCPDHASCVWAGEAFIRITFTPQDRPGVPVTLRIVGDGDEPEPKDTLGYTFTLLRLLPHPTALRPQPSGPATASIRVARSR